MENTGTWFALTVVTNMNKMVEREIKKMDDPDVVKEFRYKFPNITEKSVQRLFNSWDRGPMFEVMEKCVDKERTLALVNTVLTYHGQHHLMGEIKERLEK